MYVFLGRFNEVRKGKRRVYSFAEFGGRDVKGNNNDFLHLLLIL